MSTILAWLGLTAFSYACVAGIAYIAYSIGGGFLIASLVVLGLVVAAVSIATALEEDERERQAPRIPTQRGER